MFSFDPLENIRKPQVSRCFQGGWKEDIGKECINSFRNILSEITVSSNPIDFALSDSQWNYCKNMKSFKNPKRKCS